MLQFLFWAVVSAGSIMPLVYLLRKHFSAQLLAASFLIAMAFIYVGFALKTDSVIDIILETSAAILFFFIALIGYTKNPKWIAVGILLHGLWDTTHHLFLNHGVPASYWPLYCLTIDFIWFVYFYRMFSKQANDETKKL